MTEHGSVYYPNKKALPGWVKIVIWLAILTAIGASIAIFFTQGLVETADGQLAALRQKNISRAYYEFTSKDFRTTTSFEAFQEFVKSHPALARNESANFGERTIENNVGKLYGTLTAKDGTITPIEYKFVKEEDKWKILTMRLMPTGILSSGTLSGGETTYFSEPVEGHLQALRGNDLARAYFGFTSKEFQETTPLKSFKDFVANYPVLTRYNEITFADDVIIDDKNGTIEVSIGDDTTTAVAEYKLVKEDDKWKIWSMRLNVPSEEGQQEVALAEADTLIVPIEAQLAYLRAKDFSRAYYENSSNEFRKTTSLEGFKEFVKKYPDLANHKTVTFENPAVQGNMATITALLSTVKGSTPVDFQLIKNGNQWKVWGMQVASKTASLEKPTAFDTKDLADAIEGQLDAMRSKDISKAYYAYTSREFQKSTPSQDFEAFVKGHDVLNKNKIANFTNLSFKNGIGTFEGSLTSTNNKTSLVDYDLIFEDGQWRILSIQLIPEGEKRKNLTRRRDQTNTTQTGELSPNRNVAYSEPSELNSREPTRKKTSKRAADPRNMELTRILVGDNVNQDGYVTIPKSIFSSRQPQLHVDLYISDGDPGASASLVMEHIESRTNVPGVETQVQETGDSILSFIFTPPDRGWPQGHYRLTAKADNGKERVYSFRVE